MSYRKQRALKRMLLSRQRITQRKSKNIMLSEISLQKARDYRKEHVSPRQLPVHSKVVNKTKKQEEFIQFQQEVRLAKLLDKKLPNNSPGKILKLPIPKLSFSEEED